MREYEKIAREYGIEVLRKCGFVTGLEYREYGASIRFTSPIEIRENDRLIKEINDFANKKGLHSKAMAR